jgi:hypothetical protein
MALLAVRLQPPNAVAVPRLKPRSAKERKRPSNTGSDAATCTRAQARAYDRCAEKERKRP